MATLIVKGRMFVLLTLLISFACSRDSGVSPVHVDSTPEAVDTLPGLDVTESPLVYGDILGVNFTWASDTKIDGDPKLASGRFRHVRYFQMSEKDYNGGTPANTILEPCTDLNNPWSCSDRSMKQHLVRVKKLRAMFPDGIVWIAPEVLNNRSWPCKGFTAAELGGDPEEAGYQWGRAAFATYGTLPGIVVAMTNEEWCAGADRVNAYNDWRRGVIRAHRENPSCELAIGARHVRTRMWDGKRLPDNVNDVTSDIWNYVDSVGGWADYHAHGIVNGKFLPRDRAAEAEDYVDFYDWSAWLDNNYPNIRKSVGEISYTSSQPNVVATDAEKKADWPTYSNLVRNLADKADAIFLYQIEDHANPEGAFSGTGVYPALLPELEQFYQENLRRQ